MAPIKFTIEKKLPGKLGRAGTLETPHGIIKTPSFVVVGTKGTVKAMVPEQVKELGAQVVLSNTYHLYLQPGHEMIEKMGGLGKMMNWPGPTMTDSGGFQVFSLGVAYGKGIGKFGNELLITDAKRDKGENIAKLVKIDADGVMFRSIIDGSAHYFTPERSIEIQHAIGADMIFAFDECTSPTEGRHYQAEALDRTHRWAKRCLAYHHSKENSKRQALFGIVQGGRFEDLRKESAEVIGKMAFDGFGIGGSFAKEDMTTAVETVNAILPEEKPRHLLGIGEPEDLFMAVENGCDLFDCVAPTRLGRTGTIYTANGRVNLMKSGGKDKFGPLEEGCGCYTCKNYEQAYVVHLFKAGEMLSCTLASIHNEYFIATMVQKMREALLNDTFFEYKDAFLKQYKKNDIPEPTQEEIEREKENRKWKRKVTEE
jgi:queuine tRNA-ribosyltransferase